MANWAAKESAVFAQQLRSNPMSFIKGAALEPISEVCLVLALAWKYFCVNYVTRNSFYQYLKSKPSGSFSPVLGVFMKTLRGL